MGNFPEMLSQIILVGIIFVGRLGVDAIGTDRATEAPPTGPRGRACVLAAIMFIIDNTIMITLVTL